MSINITLFNAGTLALVNECLTAPNNQRVAHAETILDALDWHDIIIIEEPLPFPDSGFEYVGWVLTYRFSVQSSKFELEKSISVRGEVMHKVHNSVMQVVNNKTVQA